MCQIALKVKNKGERRMNNLEDGIINETIWQPKQLKTQQNKK